MKLKFDSVRFDLGIRELLPQWKNLFKLDFLREDILAGATVACIAVPLSLAIALASNVPPVLGLLSAMIGGTVAALVGGTPIGITGPAAAMAILVGSLVQRYGLDGLLMIGLGAGVLQVLSGVCGLGKIIRFTPLPVINGFTAGIGMIIFIGQLPRALGLPPAPEFDVAKNLSYIFYHIESIQLLPTVLSFGTFAMASFLPRFLPHLPAGLLAVLVITGLQAVLGKHGLDVEVIGPIPRSLPTADLPHWPQAWGFHFLQSIFVIYALASLETLMSSSAVDKLAVKTAKHDPDQELIGQGLANIVCTLFGTIPVTGVIARSALNVQTGARTRRASLFQAFFLLLSIILFAPFIEKIPIPVLSGILLSVAVKMLRPRAFLSLWKVSRIEVLTYLATFIAMICFDLLTRY